MLYREFGETGWKVSAISMGTWNIAEVPRCICTKKARKPCCTINLGFNISNSVPM